MQRETKMQIWRTIAGTEHRKAAELANTYDMPAQSAGVRKKIQFPTKKTAESTSPVKEASDLQHRQGVQEVQTLNPYIDVSSLEAPSSAETKVASRYALPEERHYPLDAYHQVKVAAAYFDEEYVRMSPESRHVYCVNLVKRAEELRIPVSELAEKYGSETYASDAAIGMCMDIRKSCITDEVHAHVLDKLAELRFALSPGDFAHTLSEFDKAAGIDQHYGVVPDAYFTTFGKRASKADDPDASVLIGTEYITRAQLGDFLRNNVSALSDRFGEEMANKLARDPRVAFDGLPQAQKLILMRMAGSSEQRQTV